MTTNRVPIIPIQRASFLWGTVLVVLVALLSTVALMQYRSTAQLSEATEARIGGNVESLMIGWHLDLYHRFSAICIALQVGPDSGAFDDWEPFSDRYAQWKRSTEIPELVEGIYIWESSQEGAPRLLRMNANRQPPQPISVEPKLAQLLKRLQERSSNLHAGLRAWQPAGADRPINDRVSGRVSLQQDSFTGWQFDPLIPAIVHPIVHHALPHEIQHAKSQDAIDWIIISLDLPTIQTKILPELNRSHFEVSGNGDYSVTVIAPGQSKPVLFDSTPGHRGAKIDESDAVMSIFGPPPESTEDNYWEAVRNANAVKVQNWHHFSAPIWFPVFEYSSDQSPWLLTLTHRSGRLEDVVAQVRRVDLFNRSVVLLLLAVSIGLVTLAAYRARHFVRMQMDFVASISHELRTPLTAIYSAGENIADGVVERKPQLTYYGSLITAQTRQLIDLVDQILAFASTRSGEKRYQLQSLTISEIIDRALKNTNAALQAKGFEIERDIAPGLPPVEGDLEALASCLQNLLVNASKYSGKNRWIRISAQLVEIRKKQKIRISVEDHGIGISPVDLSQIFKPFYRSPQARAAQIHGTGLGLALAKEIAEAMGGSLSATSSIGEGSIFSLDLPVR